MSETRDYIKIYRSPLVGDLLLSSDGKNLTSLWFVGQKFYADILLTVPFGETITYGELAKRVAKKRGVAKMSTQAIGGAVSHNSISIIIPCHRVVGTNGKLTGYSAGLDKKLKLLQLEGIVNTKLFV